MAPVCAVVVAGGSGQRFGNPGDVYKRQVHTPDESMELASAERFYELLIDVLKRLAA